MTRKLVLIADDDPMIRKLIRRVIEKEGLEVIEACNGVECMELYQTNQPAVVLVDIIMPGKDGLAAIHEIKQLDHQAKIIAISGGLVLTSLNYLEEAQDVGADFTLPKPIDRQALVATVSACMN